MHNKRWTDQELEILLSMLGDMPWPMVVTKYNAWAISQGYPERTELGMRRKVEGRRISRRPVGAWITTGLISQLLGVSQETPLRWLRDGYIRSIRFGQGAAHSHYIKRKDLQRLARERPHLFGGQSVDTLIQLLDHERLAAALVAMEMPHSRQSKPVVCIETGRRYPSMGSAARAVYVTPSRLQKVVDRPGKTAAGYHWMVAS